MYKFENQMTKASLNIAHGKARKVFLMDIISNSKISKNEWERYEKTMKAEGEPLISLDQTKKRKKQLEKERTHIATNAEIDLMIQKKNQFRKGPINSASEKIRLKNELANAELADDLEAIRSIRASLSKFDEADAQQQIAKEEKMEMFSKLNARNRLANFEEGREAEKIANQEKKQKGDAEYDPFARRKTAPKHVVNQYHVLIQQRGRRS